jgi:hypothetical protein
MVLEIAFCAEHRGCWQYPPGGWQFATGFQRELEAELDSERSGLRQYDYADHGRHSPGFPLIKV